MTKLQHNTEPPQFKVKDVEINSMLQVSWLTLFLNYLPP